MCVIEPVIVAVCLNAGHGQDQESDESSEIHNVGARIGYLLRLDGRE